MSRVPSKFQEDIYAWAKAKASEPCAKLMIKAQPGSGKTTTIVDLVQMLPSQQRIVCLCFNKHIAEELQRRVPANVTACTLNSFGWKACRAAVRGATINAHKTQDLVDSIVSDEKDKKAWRGAISKLISLKKANYKMSSREIVNLYDVDVPVERTEEFFDAASKVWGQSLKMTLTMDYDDQILMPVVKKWPVQRFDWCMVDEAQDLSATQVELVVKIAPRIIAVGDPNQSCYAFRGADPDAMPRMKAELMMDELPLSICWRCPKSVVREAQEIVPDIQWAPNAQEGAVDWVNAKDFSSQVKAGDWVLARTNAPLVKECLKLIVNGIKASVKGRDIGQQVTQLIDKVNSGTDATLISDFEIALTKYFVSESERLEAAGREAQLQSLEDKVESIRALGEGARTVGDVKNRVLNTFKDDVSPGVNFASIHRAKGLEADNVFILRPDQIPSKKAKTPWAIKQEKNLKFIAITRAMKRLAWVRKDPNEK